MCWDDDSLRIYIPRHKSDQIGLNKDEARHVYSNPINPNVCPIRAMAACLLAYPQVILDGNKLFPGSDKKVALIPVFAALCTVMPVNITLYMLILMN